MAGTSTPSAGDRETRPAAARQSANERSAALPPARRSRRALSPRRQAILEAARAVFSTAGYDRATIREIATRAGMNTALLYYYFEDKEHLYRQVLRSIIEGFLDRLEGAPWRTGGARGRVTSLVSSFSDQVVDDPQVTSLWASELFRGGEVLFQELMGVLEQYGPVPAPMRLLREGMAKGELRRVDPLHTWWCIVGMCLMSHFVRPVYAELARRRPDLVETPMDRRREVIIDLLLHGLAPDRPRKGGTDG